jgi:hypothetical protein
MSLPTPAVDGNAILFLFRLQKELAQKARTITELKATLEAQSREIKVLTDTNKVINFITVYRLFLGIVQKRRHSYWDIWYSFWTLYRFFISDV